MSKFFLTSLALSIGFLVSAPSSYGQGAARTGPASAVLRDSDLEKDSLHNLEVARNYFKLKKAYVAALKRCEEILAGNPNFANIDEVLFIAGRSANLLAEGRGKQKAELYVVIEEGNKKKLTPEQFRNDARGYLTQLINEHPQSKFRQEAEAELQAVGGSIKPEAAKP